MDNLNYVFFEEFKHLDKLCGELYGDQHGISRYISDMKEASGNDYRNIPNWQADLERLIRLRHIRNYLAHTEGAFNEEVCTQKDIEWSREFHGRILSQSDPLAMLYQYSKVKQQRVNSRKRVQQYRESGQAVQPRETMKEADVNKGKGLKTSYWIILFIVIILALILAVFGIAVLLV